jgi:hypothetical protein
MAWALEPIDEKSIEEFYEINKKYRDTNEVLEVKEIIFQIGQKINKIPLCDV